MNLRDFLAHLSSEPAWLHAGAVTPLTRATNGDTPLHAAIWARDDEAARQLIDAGADVNAPGEDGYTPIHAALAQSNVPLARRLTACGASWEAVNKFACSVRDAARRSDDPAVRALLEQEEVVSRCPAGSATSGSSPGITAICGQISSFSACAPSSSASAPPPWRRASADIDVDAVCGPLVEGAFVALMVASDLGVEFYYTERFAPQADGSPQSLFPVEYRVPAVLRDRLRGKRVAIVNDVISAGSAVRGTLVDLEACGAETVAMAALAVLGPSAGRVRRSSTSWPSRLWPRFRSRCGRRPSARCAVPAWAFRTSPTGTGRRPLQLLWMS